MERQWRKQQILAGIMVLAATINIGAAQAQRPLPADFSIADTIPMPRSIPNRVPIGVPVGTEVENGTANEVQEYFKKRWKRDPNFNDYLRYHLALRVDGRVKSIVGIGDNSQIYLERTNFIRIGDKLVAASDREHVVQIFLNGNGAVGVYPLKTLTAGG